MSKYITADEYEKYDKFIKDEPCEEIKVFCEDSISRRAVLDKAKYRIMRREIPNGFAEKRGYFIDVDDIADLPSVQPSRPTEHKPICDDCIYFADGKGSEKCDSCELTGTNKPSRRKGHWIKHPNGIYAHLVCDKCLSNAPYDIKTNYCPNCGAEMESEE